MSDQISASRSENAAGSGVVSRDLFGDWAFRAARHMRNAERTPALRWGAAAIELLAELRDIDPSRYDREVKEHRSKATPKPTVVGSFFPDDDLAV